MAETLLVVITLSLGLSFILSQICRSLKIPEIIGLIGAGAIFSIPFFAGIFSVEARLDIAFLAEVGIVFLLLLAGLETKVNKLRKLSMDSLLISIFGALFPFILGYFAVMFLGYSQETAIIAGICMAITAEGTTLKVLIDKDRLDTKVGTIIMASGILDDVYGIIFLSTFLMLLREDKTMIYTYPLMIFAFIALCMVLFFVLPKIIRMIEREHSKISNLTMTLLIGLGIAALSSVLGLGPIPGAFIAGVLIHLVNKEKQEEHDIVSELKILTFSFIIPFFFINIGFNMDFTGFMANIPQMLVIIIVAIAGKMLGSVIVSLFSDITLRQSILIGWGMNSRGAIELVIASVALNAGLLPINLYTSLVIMAIITTLFFPFILERYLKKDPTIMNE